jgi:hypothetical protein
MSHPQRTSPYPFQLLEETDISSFNSRRENLPERFGSLNIGYNNGPLKRHARAITPNPARTHGTYGTTNYLLAEWREIAFWGSVGD